MVLRLRQYGAELPEFAAACAWARAFAPAKVEPAPADRQARDVYKRQVQSITFHLKSNTTDRSDRISLRGNDKEDYELHFRFTDDKCATGSGEVWFASDNRPGEFSVPVRFRQ